MQAILKLILELVISLTILSIIVLFLAASIRRWLHARRYRQLDELRDNFRREIPELIRSTEMEQLKAQFQYEPKSLEWIALEEVLLELMSEEGCRDKGREFFNALGYGAYYEDKLRRSNIIIKASAIDKLGKMQCVAAVPKLVTALDSNAIEIISVTIRSLSKIGALEGLRGILERLPDLFQKSMVTRKTVETYLPSFGPGAVPMLIESVQAASDPAIKASLLEVLTQIRGVSALPLARACLQGEDPEVRARALKLIGTIAPEQEEFDWDCVVASARDPVWFVRLRAAKALGNKKYEKAIPALAELLLDEKWFVRNAAATALTRMENAPLGEFLRVLRSSDTYARGSVCEEMQKTNYVDRLIENLASPDNVVYEQSGEIIDVMCSLKFCTPFTRYIEQGDNEEIKGKIRNFLKREVEV
ncbi:MAG: hypothetical protein C4532_17720 [Candidatus Abyssobacteria bacterium SURF_17]|uniref:HEAT repeat domain-containing protein n=1 Tax=Candidatus Abyssobacteria bacterium SURF_17 TaxID=2093361 RepID=A0A419EQF2_9BACT|nr:MAG: hypothetical protein C4532_17720 [Candidatus Abyssubacteria bacterium SURF_17]